MEVKKLFIDSNIELQGALLLKNKIFFDKKGFFKESWNEKYFNTIVGIDQNFVQDNHSFSIKGVIRGMHYQKEPMAQGKLIRCIRGEIYDVIVDIREKSQTFLNGKE